jgi:flagellar brake protein
MTQLAQMSPEEIEDRYALRGRMEILFVLEEMIHRREPVSVHFDGGKEMFLTTLLEVKPLQKKLIFDWTGSRETNHRVLQSRHAVFVARPDGIRVQFSSGHVELVEYGDDQAFAITLPDLLLRLQRREFFRIDTPLARPLRFGCWGAAPVVCEVPIHDLSVAGLALTVVELPDDWQAGLALERCAFALPGHSDVIADAHIRHITELDARNGQRQWRVGLQFENLGPSMEVHLQRYIVKVEHDRHTIADGHH